jgi:hypothetical protein
MRKELLGVAAVWIIVGSLLAYLGYPTWMPSFRRWSTVEQGAPAGAPVDTGL